MADRNEHTERLRELFREEACEHVATIHRALKDARDPGAGRTKALETALRAAHSLKGGASIAGARAIGTLVHDWESCAASLARGAVACDDAALGILTLVLDAVSDELTRSTGGEGTAASVEIKDAFLRMRGHFGDRVPLQEVPGDEDPRVDVDASPAHGQGTVRVAVHKLDRQMAGIEELLRLKAGAEQRLLVMGKMEESLERLRARISETRRLARAGQGDARARTSVAARTLSSLDELGSAADETTSAFSGIALEIRQATHALSSLSDALHGDVRAARMLPIDSLFTPFERMVRDLARRTQKRAVLRTSGGTTEVDRDVLETVKDPVMHLLRNGMDHGIEPPDERRAAGKEEEGAIRIAARSSAGMLEIEVADDGRGIDARAVARAALERGIASEDQLAQMDDERIRSLVFRDGFSTSSSVNDLSGRGIGLAVVRSAVERVGGRVAVATELGRGTAFTLFLPLNLTTSRLLLVRVGEEVFAVPAGSVERVLRVPRTSLIRVDSGFAFDLEGRPVGIHSLAEALGLPLSAPRDRLLAILLSTASGRVAFVVDRVLDELALVARDLGDHLSDVQHVSGAAVLADGSVAPILNAAELVRGARTAEDGALVGEDGGDARVVQRVLVVDDSVTTRTLEKSILEAAGYDVEVATDGAEAVDLLRRGTFDLVLSDVQMPKMDGLTLTRTMKQDARLKAIPVVLVSSLDGTDQRKQGLDAGADAYLSKADFEQGTLLATLRRFL